MPRGVLVLSSDADLFATVRAILRTDPRFIDTEDAVHCDGRAAPLTNIHPIVMDEAEWRDWPAPDTAMPDPRTLSVLLFETRSTHWIAEVGRLLAQGVRSPVWVVDSADTVWAADRIDPTLMVLD